jgi:phage shock protein E
MSFLVNNKWVFLGVGLGMAGGFAWWYFVGCDSGGCAITSNPYRSTLYGGLMGWLMVSAKKDLKTKQE